jgi:dTDP-4-dehydrorhamnose reductase
MTTLVFGAGFLGRRIAEVLPNAVVSTVDIADRAAVATALDAHGVGAVVNCAGKTGRPNVDWCETHQEETYRANVVGPLVLAEECRRRDVYLLHLGSGCIFCGPSPSPGGWREDDVANPISFYSRTKYAADLVLSRLSGVGIVRLRMPIDDRPGPRNLITKLAGYTQIIDVENSVTVVEDLLLVVQGLLERRASGVFHAVNPGVLRHRDLLNMYRELVDPAHRFEMIPEEELVTRGLALKARSNCIVADTNLGPLGLAMRPLGVALRVAMTRYAASEIGDRLREPRAKRPWPRSRAAASRA